MSKMQNLLERLSNVHGPSGYEENVRKIIEEEIKPYVDEIRTDKMGNLIATKNPGQHPSVADKSEMRNPSLRSDSAAPSVRGKPQAVMLAAHMDEISLMTRYVDDKGFIYFTKSGGWFDQTLLNQRMIVHSENGPLYGVIGSKPPHVIKEEDRKKPILSDDMFIDIGATSKEDANKMGVDIGTNITLDTQFKSLINDKVTGKAFDNRAGCTMLIHALEQMNPTIKATVYAVFTVQEEVGLNGARTSAFGLNPGVAIATDVCFTGDHPGIDKKTASVEMGKGPAITVSDNEGKGIIVPTQVLKWLKEAAISNGIPYQLEVTSGGTTDASAIHLTREGIPAGVISPPARYIHSPVSVLSMSDLENCAKLVARAVEIVDKFF